MSIAHALSENIQLNIKEQVSEVEQDLIAKFKFHLPIYYTGDLLDVKMQIDSNGLYEIKAYHARTGEEIEYEPTRTGALNEEQKQEAKNRIRTLINVS